MSTKIYNGYVLPVMSILDLRKFYNKVGVQIRQVAQEMLTEQVAGLSACIIDRGSAGLDISNYTNNATSTNPLLLAYDFINDRQRKVKETNIRDPECDYLCSLVILPLNDRLPCILYTEKKAFTKIWEAQKEVTSFPYWNNTDKPTGITAEEWGERKRIWDIALGKTTVPSLEGLTVEFLCNLPLWPKPENVVAYFPTFEQRVNKLAVEIVMNKKYEEVGDKISIDNIMGVLEKAQKYAESKKGQMAIEAQKIKLKKVLKPTISTQDLLEKII